MLSFDLLVVGAGPAGTALAWFLARRGWSVGIVERSEPPERRVGETLASVARQSLAELGLWEAFSRQSHRPAFANRSAWGSADARERTSIFSPYGESWHLDRARFDAWLRASARSVGVSIRCPGRVLGVEEVPTGRRWRMIWSGDEGDEVIEARYLADATGRAAWLSRKLGATRRDVDRSIAFVRWFAQPDAEPMTLIEAHELGWWYSAPVPSEGVVIAWMTDAAVPAAGVLSSAFVEGCLATSPLTRARLLGAHAIDAATCSAAPGITDWDTRMDVLPIGDAAVAFDPVSGDGLCFALRSALEAAYVFEHASPSAFADYRDGARRVFDHHLRLRRAHYALERRWPDSIYWQSRALEGG